MATMNSGFGSQDRPVLLDDTFEEIDGADVPFPIQTAGAASSEVENPAFTANGARGDTVGSSSRGNKRPRTNSVNVLPEQERTSQSTGHSPVTTWSPPNGFEGRVNGSEPVAKKPARQLPWDPSIMQARSQNGVTEHPKTLGRIPIISGSTSVQMDPVARNRGFSQYASQPASTTTTSGNGSNTNQFRVPSLPSVSHMGYSSVPTSNSREQQHDIPKRQFPAFPQLHSLKPSTTFNPRTGQRQQVPNQGYRVPVPFSTSQPQRLPPTNLQASNGALRPNFPPRETFGSSAGVGGTSGSQSTSFRDSAVVDLTLSESESDSESSKPKPKKEGNDIDEDEIEFVGHVPGIRPDDTPICLGQISSLVLILYPIEDITSPSVPGPSGQIPRPNPLAPPQLQPVPVLIHRAVPQGANETLKVSVPRTGEIFGVIEHRVANVIGSLLLGEEGEQGGSPGGSNLVRAARKVQDVAWEGRKRGEFGAKPGRPGIWIECTVLKRGERSPMMLPMQLLIYAHPSHVQHVSLHLQSNSVFLEHPSSYEPSMHCDCRYSNPHNPYMRSGEERRRRDLLNGLAGGFGGRPYGAAKSVDVQREQVEEVFKNLTSGVDLQEVEPDPIVTTPLYPHQKQALAFLLDRERLHADNPSQDTSNGKQKAKEEELVALWRRRRDVYGRPLGWTNVITNLEIGGTEPPPQNRGAILADDMGLGKTIVIISLIASTIREATTWASKPANTSKTQSAFETALSAYTASSSAVSVNDFSTVFAMPRAGPSTSGKKKKESKMAKKKEEAEVARYKRLKLRSRATLIICPLSTVQNWESQMDEHVRRPKVEGKLKSTKDPATSRGGGGDGGMDNSDSDSDFGTLDTGQRLKVYIYHGNARTNSVDELADHDVVITTFSTLGTEYSKQLRSEAEDEGSSSDGLEEVGPDGAPLTKAEGKKGKKKRKKGGEGGSSPLQQIQWFRVVLDEAHMIKEHTTNQAQAACELVADRRQCLTGTPLQNSLNDLFSLVRFLRLEPFTDRGLWTQYIGAPTKIGDPLGVSRLQVIMRHLALRRTKTTVGKDGRPILSLPGKKDEMRYLDLDEREKAFYASHHRRYKSNFLKLEESDSLLKNYCSILQELLRLRQICAHMALVRDSEDAELLKGNGSEDLIAATKRNGLTKGRAIQLLALMRDAGSAQCAECACDLLPAANALGRDDLVEDCEKRGGEKGKRSRKGKASDNNDDCLRPTQRPVLTRCQHLFCLQCFRAQVSAGWPSCSADERAACSACREEMTPILDAIEVLPSELEANQVDGADGGVVGRKVGTVKDRRRQQNGYAVEHSTKVKALLADLFPFSRANPTSENFSPNDVPPPTDADSAPFQPVAGEIVKSVVFSQWTKMLDRIEDALDECQIKFQRLDGSMTRPDRSHAIETFKSDPQCEVLLVSLRAGGVGLNLTAARRVYLMEPFWNPAVENQAVDRIHRLGQTRPVHTIRFIIRNSIEANMLEIQKRKTELANLSLSQTLTKEEVAKRRVEDLKVLFK